jgi:hypothetical protein
MQQVGVTPEGVELPRSAVDPSVCSKVSELSEENRPQLPTGPDPKWRYMWRVGLRPGKTRFQVLLLSHPWSDPKVVRHNFGLGTTRLTAPQQMAVYTKGRICDAEPIQRLREDERG